MAEVCLRHYPGPGRCCMPWARAAPRKHLSHVGVDHALAGRCGDGDSVVTVGHEVQMADAVYLDRRDRLAAPDGHGQPFPPGPHSGRGWPEAPVEVAPRASRAASQPCRRWFPAGSSAPPAAAGRASPAGRQRHPVARAGCHRRARRAGGAPAWPETAAAWPAESRSPHLPGGIRYLASVVSVTASGPEPLISCGPGQGRCAAAVVCPGGSGDQHPRRIQVCDGPAGRRRLRSPLRGPHT